MRYSRGILQKRHKKISVTRAPFREKHQIPIKHSQLQRVIANKTKTHFVNTKCNYLQHYALTVYGS